MVCDSSNPQMKNAQPSVKTGRKWKVKIAVEYAESAFKMKEIIGTAANGRAGLDLHPQSWWSKKSIINKRKIVSEEIHLKEVRRIAKAIGQGKQGTWTKWESAKDTAIT